MQLISGPDAARAVLCDPAFVVPPVPAAPVGVGWLRANVGRFSSGEDHERRRALSVAILDAIPPDVLRTSAAAHPVAAAQPVAVLARAMGVHDPVVDLVRDVAQAYQPGTGAEARADAAVIQLVAVFGGVPDEATASRIGVLVQACQATVTLIERARDRPVEDVLRDDPPVPTTRRQALVAATIGDVAVSAGDEVHVSLADGLAFGAGPRRCPGQAHALALVDGALR